MKCSTPLDRPPTGRPPTYCSTACRRAAEYEVRRLQRRLDAAEREVEREWEALAFGYGSADYRRKRLAFAEQHLARLEERLRSSAN